MTSATERLRALLDERGVEWWCGEDERKTYWRSNGLTWEYFNDENGDAWLGFLGACESDVTPEQAIAATLGPGTCEVEVGSGCSAGWWVCSACGALFDMVGTLRRDRKPCYCPNCGKRVVG